MRLLVKLRSFLRNLFSSHDVEVDHDEEVHSRRQIKPVKEQLGEEPIRNWLHSVISDCGYGARQLRKNPGFTIVAVLTLALGIGATTAIFSVVYGVLVAAAAVSRSEPDHGRLRGHLEGQAVATCGPELRRLSRSKPQLPGDCEVQSDNVASVSGASQPTRTTVADVSPDFLKVFGIQPILGRDFSASDAKKGAGPTVLVSYGYWRQYLGSARDLSQSHLKIDGAVFSVIGVLPAGFRFPADVDLWLPADLDGENPSRTSHNYYAVGRLRDGVTVEQANQDISAIARRIHDTSSEQGDYLLKDGIVVPLQDSITGKARSPLLVLLGAVGFLLLVACANVANLLLAQASVERARARHSQRARCGARTADPSIPYRSIPAFAGRRRPWRTGSARGRGGISCAGAGKSAAAGQRLDQYSRACVRVPPFHRGRRRPRSVHRRTRDFRRPAEGLGGRRPWTSGFARQPARWPG